MLMRIIAASVLMVSLQAEGGLQRVQLKTFMPNAGYEQAYVPIELLFPNKKATPAAKQAIESLRRAMAKTYHLAGPGDTRGSLAKCTARIFQPDSADIPAYRLDCWSVVLSQKESLYERIGEAATPEEVLAFCKKFAEEHFERMKQEPVTPAKIPLRPTGGRNYIV